MNFTKLKVWQKAHDLSVQIYEITEEFPGKENYRLVDQLCRASSSITANIAEGSGRRTIDEYIHFISNSRGSVEETINHIILAKDLDYLTEEEAKNLIEGYKEVGKMLNGLINSLEEKKSN